MFAIIGAIIFIFIALFTLFVMMGLPLGEFTMGGQTKVLPKDKRYMAFVSLLIQVFAAIVILQAGGHIILWFSYKLTKYICFFFAIYLILNTIMNYMSKSKKEKYVMMPLSLVAAICYWIVAIQM